MIRKSLIPICALFGLCWSATSLIAAESGTAKCEVRITEPKEGQEVGGNITVRGTATISPSFHLWTFARRVSPYRTLNVWWPQGEGTVDPATGKWEMPAALGIPEDVGFEFDVTAAVFSDAQHVRLLSDFKNAMRTNNFQPDEMPPVVCAAARVTIKKAKK